MRFILSIFFIIGCIQGQEAPKFIDLQKNGGWLIPELINETAKFLITDHPALLFWLMQSYHMENPKKKVNSVNVGAMPLFDIQVNAKGDRTLFISWNTGMLIDTQKNIIIATMPIGLATKVAFSSDGTLLALNIDDEISIYSTIDGTIKNKFKHGHSFIIELIFNPKKNVLVSLGSDGLIKMFDIEKNSIVDIFTTDASTYSLSFNFDGTMLAACSENFVTVYDLKNHTTIKLDHKDILKLNHICTKAEFHPHKNQLLITVENLNQVENFIWQLDPTCGISRITNLKDATFVLDGSYILGFNNANGIPTLCDMQGQKKYELSQLIGCETFQVAPNKKFVFYKKQQNHLLYDILHGIKIATYRFTFMRFNYDCSLLVGYQNDCINLIPMYDNLLKNNLLKEITINSAQLLIDTYKNRSVVNDGKIPAAIQNIFINTQKAAQERSENMVNPAIMDEQDPSKKRKHEDIN